MAMLPRDYFWDLAMPAPRFFWSPFGDDILRDLAHMQTAMERTFDDMQRQFQGALTEAGGQTTAGAVAIKNDANHLAIDLDVKDYKPEELQVKVHHHTLTITGKHEEKDETGKHSVKREFTRQFLLPKEVDPATVVSHLEGGKLCVEAPKKALPAPAERMIPIEQKK